jgi:hypothetical protein
MPVLSVFVDRVPLCTVRTDGLDMLNVGISGSKIDEAFATLEVSGGTDPESGESTYLIWLDAFALQPGQCVRVEISDHGSTSAPGKTIDECFPEAPEQQPQGPPRSREQLVNALRARSHVREQYAIKIKSSSGARQIANVGDNEHGFGASFVWNYVRPARVSASVHTYSLEQMAKDEDFTSHFHERLEPEAWVEVTIDA